MLLEYILLTILIMARKNIYGERLVCILNGKLATIKYM